jgi:HEAT repeat protein
VTDARYKAIFKSGESIYQLYDLKTDPGEKYNLSADHIEVLERLRAALAQHLAFTARLDAIAAKTERDWPEALTRALLGDPSAGPDLVPLLGSQRAEVKIAAARGCAEIGYRAALPVLSTLWEHKTDPARYEAAIAALLLGDKNAAALVLEALNQVRKRADVESLYVARRAALALSRASITAGILVLITWAQDTNADLRDRKRAIDALSAIGSRKALKPLCGLLSDPYLRIDVANALGKIGDRSAVSPLAKQLASEPYPPAREALTNAIEKLKSENRRHKPLYSHLENSR